MSLFTDLNEPGVAGVDYGNRVLLVQAFLALRIAMMFSVEMSMACTIGIF